MVETLDVTEQAPASYPDAPEGLSSDAQALDTEALWQRIESWIAYRWGERTVTWIVEGPGVWVPTLKPATVNTFEVWRDGWQTVTLEEAPLGYTLEAHTYRFTTTVGNTDAPPATILEAYRRLAEYLADDAHIGRVATSGTRSIGDSLSITAERPASWQAKALHYSGAADLLRPWRR